MSGLMHIKEDGNDSIKVLLDEIGSSLTFLLYQNTYKISVGWEQQGQNI